MLKYRGQILSVCEILKTNHLINHLLLTSVQVIVPQLEKHIIYTIINVIYNNTITYFWFYKSKQKYTKCEVWNNFSFTLHLSFSSRNFFSKSSGDSSFAAMVTRMLFLSSVWNKHRSKGKRTCLCMYLSVFY